MKIILACILLGMPFISSAMDKTKVRRKESPPSGSAAVLPVSSKGTSIQDTQKNILNEHEDECATFAASLCDMRYYHLADDLLKKAFKATIEMTLTHGEELLYKKDGDAHKDILAQKLLEAAQFKLAEIVGYTCTNCTLVTSAELLFGKISDKYKEATKVTYANDARAKKKVVHDMEVYSTLGFMLEHYNELTGTTRKDMLKGTEPVAARLITKANEAKGLTLSTAS